MKVMTYPYNTCKCSWAHNCSWLDSTWHIVDNRDHAYPVSMQFISNCENGLWFCHRPTNVLPCQQQPVNCTVNCIYKNTYLYLCLYRKKPPPRTATTARRQPMVTPATEPPLRELFLPKTYTNLCHNTHTHAHTEKHAVYVCNRVSLWYSASVHSVDKASDLQAGMWIWMLLWIHNFSEPYDMYTGWKVPSQYNKQTILRTVKHM